MARGEAEEGRSLILADGVVLSELAADRKGGSGGVLYVWFEGRVPSAAECFTNFETSVRKC